MEINYSRELPKKVELMGARRKINYDVRELTDSEIEALYEGTEKDVPLGYFAKEHRYAYRSVVIGGGRMTYEGVVEAIIREKYSIDEMEAITNNMAAVNAVFLQTLVTEGIVAATKYLKDSVDEINSSQFKEMQEWRRMAKNEAKGIFDL